MKEGDGLSTGYRRVMLATYLRVNHWADFDESYSDGKLSAAATPSSNAGGAIARCAARAVQKERRNRLWAIIRAGDNWVYWSTPLLHLAALEIEKK